MSYSLNKSVPLRKQQGLVLVLVTILLIIFVVFAAFAIDVNHMFMNKSRLQNGVDAAALAAAVKVSSGESDSSAESRAIEVLTSMYQALGNDEFVLPEELVAVDFSNDPQDFSSSYDEAGETYVRVAVNGLTLPSYFLNMFDVSKVITASAVAGPSSQIENACNLVPMAVCASPSSGANDFLGYEYEEVYKLKVPHSSETSMGNGNFQLLDFGSGGSTVRHALAGGFDECIDIIGDVTTKPGGTVGPVGDGLNSRFGDYQGSGGLEASDYPPDIYTKEPSTPATTNSDGSVNYDNSWKYSDYLAESALCGESGSPSGCMENGELNRRILAVPMVNCDDADGGVNELPVRALGCFFLLQRAPTNNSEDLAVYGEFIEDCTVTNGTTGSTPGNEGVYRIQLYKDPLSGES